MPATIPRSEVVRIERFFRDRLRNHGINPNHRRVHIPAPLAVEWLSEFVDEQLTVATASRWLRSVIRSGLTQHLFRNTTHKWNRGFLWVPKKWSWEPTNYTLARRTQA